MSLRKLPPERSNDPSPSRAVIPDEPELERRQLALARLFALPKLKLDISAVELIRKDRDSH